MKFYVHIIIKKIIKLGYFSPSEKNQSVSIENVGKMFYFSILLCSFILQL